MGVTNQLLHNFDKEAKIIKRSGKHVKQSTQGDLSKVRSWGTCFTKSNAYDTRPHSSCFTGIGQSLLHGVNSNKLYSWINEHKRKLF